MSVSAETSQETMTVTVRYFAAARAAAGIDEERMTCPTHSTIATILATAADRLGAEFARVLDRCSFLHNAVAVHDTAAATLTDGDTIDVLPPFAGG